MPKPKPCDGNSEESLIRLIRDILLEFTTKVTAGISGLVERLTNHETKTEERQRQIMNALETLTAAINANTAGQADLTSAVNDAITRLGTPSASDAQLLSLAELVKSSTASDAALTAALRAALSPPIPA